MCKLLYCKFIQDNVCQILSESTGFCGRYDKNILGCFFGSQCSILQCSVKLAVQVLYMLQQIRPSVHPPASLSVRLCVRSVSLSHCGIVSK